jgi:hypothetical protein
VRDDAAVKREHEDAVAKLRNVLENAAEIGELHESEIRNQGLGMREIL